MAEAIHKPRKPILILPIVLIVAPFVILLSLFLISSFIYSQFHPPAVFDELTATNTSIERAAYAINSTLFDLSGIVLFAVGPLSIVCGIIILIVRLLKRRNYAKN